MTISPRPLSKPLTGIERYTAEIINELIKKQSDFYLYYASPISVGHWQQNNVKIRADNFNGRLGTFLWSQTYLPFYATKDNLDIFWSPAHRLPRFLPRRTARIVTIYDMVWKHAGETMRMLNRLIECKLMPDAIRRADIIVAVSFSTANDIEKEYPYVGNKIRVVYSGVTKLSAPLNFQSLSSLGINTPYFLFVGTLEPRKNIKRLMQAFASLGETNQDLSLVIAGGSGWGDVNINQWIHEYGLNGKVFPVGYVTNQQLATLYANALFLAMPSLYEGFGLPIVEAMSFGKAVLTSNISSMPEVAGKAAVLVDPLDVHSIALALNTLIDKNERNKLETEAKQNAERFTWRASAEQLWGVFQEAIDIRKNTMQSSSQ